MENDYEYIQSFFKRNQNDQEILFLKKKFEDILKKFPGNEEKSSKLLNSLKIMIENFEEEKELRNNFQKEKMLKEVFKKNKEKCNNSFDKFYSIKRKLKENIFYKNHEQFSNDIVKFNEEIIKLCNHKAKKNKIVFDQIASNLNRNK